MDNCKNRCHVEISQPYASGVGTTIKLNEEEIPLVTEVNYNICAGEIPEVKLTVLGIGILDLNCDYVKVDISPANLKDAVIILRDELLKHDYLYDSFMASIKSAVTEQLCKPEGTNDDELAEAVLKRIIGEA